MIVHHITREVRFNDLMQRFKRDYWKYIHEPQMDYSICAFLQLITFHLSRITTRGLWCSPELQINLNLLYLGTSFTPFIQKSVSDVTACDCTNLMWKKQALPNCPVRAFDLVHTHIIYIHGACITMYLTITLFIYNIFTFWNDLLFTFTLIPNEINPFPLSQIWLEMMRQYCP